MIKLIVGIVLFLLGIVLLLMGKKSLRRFEEKHPPERHHSGVLFQWNTWLIYIGYLLLFFGVGLIVVSF